MKNKLTGKLNKLLDMPKDVLNDEPKISLVGFEEIYIENYKSILEYEEYFIRIKTSIGVVNMFGSKLNLNQINNDDICVTGSIEKIEFERD
jgi:sporulation protein YqfC